ncbi:MAG: ribosome small subunit-dependent GTPase A [Oscillospiraceae bacterium]|jgi:ribosome biogenesis GTPase|nr:ribosome small subunit-dependent GTPase A [Oscillospiraceae bacterium]
MIDRMIQGLILQGIGGFYSVETADRVYECRARGIFRKNKVTPLAGDFVRISAEPDGTGTVDEILPRRNCLLRPPVANLDQLVIVVSACEPSPNLLNTDRVIAAALDKGIEPVLVFSKTDLMPVRALEEIYANTGIRRFSISCETGEGVQGVLQILAGKTTAFTGNSGVGKSTLLNSMFRGLDLQTGEISHKLGRGRHTTRKVQLLKLDGGGYVADTPGFSSITLEKSDRISKENLPLCFPEFLPYLQQCRFTSCSHTCEKGCAVLQAVRDGKISESRHESYTAMYREMDGIREWNKK